MIDEAIDLCVYSPPINFWLLGTTEMPVDQTAHLPLAFEKVVLAILKRQKRHIKDLSTEDAPKGACVSGQSMEQILQKLSLCLAPALPAEAPQLLDCAYFW
jgi:hypothetical protein